MNSDNVRPHRASQDIFTSSHAGPPSHGYVHVWWRTQAEVLAGVRTLAADENSFLTPGDVFSLSRTTHEKAREARRCARVLFRALVAQLYGPELARAELLEGAHGKPSFPKRHSAQTFDAAPEFSLSHSGDAVAVALSHAGPVGIDVEAGTMDALRAARMAPRVLDPHSLLQWEKLAPEERTAAFLCQWTLREALLKATGEGLTRDPRSLGVPLMRLSGASHEVQVEQAFSEPQDSTPGSRLVFWRVHLLCTAPHAALAAGPQAKVRVF